MSEFAGKVVVVTGSTSGIGRATVLAFAREGCCITITGLPGEDFNSIVKECQDVGIPEDKILTLEIDVTKKEDCERLISQTARTFGKIDILVNNAGTLHFGGLEDTDLETFDRLFSVNARAVFYLMKLAMPHLILTKGNIVNVSSATALIAIPNMLAYSTSKATINHMTKCVSVEVASKGVRVNAVNPGVIKTKLVNKAGIPESETEAYFERMKAWHPVNRIGTPEEVAESILFLASDRASFTTGTLLPVDGGQQHILPNL